MERITQALTVGVLVQSDPSSPMFHADTDQGSPPAWARYTAAIVLTTFAVTARMALTPTLGATALPFITFFPAVAIAAWYGRLWPAVLSVILCALAGDWLFM